ncbi:hypothetical protein JOC78_001233 [Bacillus ectoiniformans]|uniref:hypothetical protein n=1 Tax=Bacillus ectoiniformans TaxID=1494429 RepID=UPI00195C9C52|nr:hypothetical protein [Bacillus ectoiniformans]MBM7648291.1 hypothetical protein [Bacillus ectoiniformans]
MREFVGKCEKCQKDIYCLDGFLNGMKIEGALLCFECGEEKSDFKKTPSQS